VREGLRIVGDWVLTQNTIVGGAYVNDSITIGSWVYDIHVVSRTPVKGPNGTLVANNEGQMFTRMLTGGKGREKREGKKKEKRNESLSQGVRCIQIKIRRNHTLIFISYYSIRRQDPSL
jgi:hypothetical protein